MAIAWGVDVHFVKPDYMAALITAMIATDRLFDNITKFLDNWFHDEDDNRVHCGVLGN